MKPRPDDIKELLLRSMPHGIFLRVVSVLEALKLRLDAFGGTGTFEDMVMQDIGGLRCVSKGFD